MTLVDQSAGLAGPTPAADAEPATSEWRSVQPFRDEVVTLYQAGRTVNAIAVELGIAWDSAALLLEKAGLRQRRKRSGA